LPIHTLSSGALGLTRTNRISILLIFDVDKVFSADLSTTQIEGP
jgi:hypothetical protein